MLMVLLRAQAVAEDPDAYLAGSSLGASNGQCAPLPPSGTGVEYYEATCEEGAQLIDEARTCRVPLVIETGGSQHWEYSCFSDEPQPGHAGVCSNVQGALQSGGCTLIDRERVGETCLQWVRPPNSRPWCAEPGEPLYREVWACPAQLPGVFGGFLRNTTRIVSETRDEGQCQAATEGLTCTQSGEVCTGQAETRTINGLAVTRPCWEWERTYQCNGTGQATDCSDIAGNPQCTFVRDECLDDPQVGACQLTTKVYRCPIPGGGKRRSLRSTSAAMMCYCIDGECEPIFRGARLRPSSRMLWSAFIRSGKPMPSSTRRTLRCSLAPVKRAPRGCSGSPIAVRGKGVPFAHPLPVQRSRAGAR